MLLTEYDEAKTMRLFKEEGREEMKEEENLSNIRRAIKKQKMTLEEAMDYMDIPDVLRTEYAAKLREGEGENAGYHSN